MNNILRLIKFSKLYNSSVVATIRKASSNGLGINLASQNKSTLAPIPQFQGWNKHHGKWTYYLPVSVSFIPALSTVYCDSYDLRGKQEKRLFKAIQYGLTHEVSK